MNDQLIHESMRSRIYLRTGSDWLKPVLVKVLNYEFPTPADIRQFDNEYEVLSRIKLPSVRNVLQYTREQNRHAIILEWIEGKNLLDTFKERHEDIAFFLDMAIAIADAVGEIHRSHITHKNITPYNILIDSHDRSVKIIDFGISSLSDTTQLYTGNAERLEGTIAYCSPEQTGRMNRMLDYRTDLYSLGITFYQLLTGELPFKGNDAIELVYAHIAQKPKPLHDVNSSVPRQLSYIILKLLAKNADDRYQSAWGLKRDLEKCRDLYHTSRSIEEFQLAANDFSGKFILPQKLYGREAEIDSLLAAFENCTTGYTNHLLVAGHSGTGKSTLVHEVHKSITAKRGYFISGKYDQFQRAVPYYAILMAFSSLVDMLLTEHDHLLQEYASRIRQALGQEGKVLTSVLPNLVHIIGEQPPVPEVGGIEVQNRFNYTFQKFVRTICTKAHPVVLFADDMQWADSASLSLLQILMSDPESQYLMCICAYRDNEVSASHPFTQMINALKDAAVTVSEIKLENLLTPNINALIADAARVSEETAQPLAELIYKKTIGNAFFVRQFLTSIAERQLLRFNFQRNAWEWNTARISQENISDNVVVFMAEKVRAYPEETIAVLKIGACYGNMFHQSTICVVTGHDQETVDHALYYAINGGLIANIGKGIIKFTHDRIQQAVYSMIPEREQQKMHLEIGRRLLSSYTEGAVDEHLFEVVNQLNKGIMLIAGEPERNTLVSLNLRAGRLAKTNSAFRAAYDYYETAISLLNDDAWHNRYDVCLPVFTEGCEAAYLSGDFDRMEQLHTTIVTHAHTILDKVKSFEIRILAFKARNNLLAAIGTGLDVLEELGEKFPGKPTRVHVFAGLADSMYRLSGKRKEDLLNLPSMEDPEKIAAMRIIADITSSVYWAMPALLPLLVFRMISISIRYGNNAVSCFAYGSYGVILCGVLGRMKKGNEFGLLSLGLLDKLNVKEWIAQIYCAPYALIFHWRNHVRTTLAALQQSFQIGLETGLIEFGCINTNIYCIHSFLAGKPLVRLEHEIHAYSDSYLQLKQETNYNYNEVYRQAVLNFMGEPANMEVLTGAAFDEQKMMAQNKERDDKTGAFFIHFLKLMLCYHSGGYEHALVHAAHARKLLNAVLAKFEIPNHHFYESLTALMLASHNTGTYKRNLLRLSRRGQQALKKWAKDAPQNFMHKYELLEAERLRVTDNPGKAMPWYDRAIEGAARNEFLHEEGLARELAGRCCHSHSLTSQAEFYLKAAYNTYREWGAVAKLQQLEQAFPQYLSGVSRTKSTRLNHADNNTSSIFDSSILDIDTVMKASTSISGEVVFSRLLEVLIRIVMENAGAEKGFLLLEQDDTCYIEAGSDQGTESIVVLQHMSPAGKGILAEGIMLYVIRTRENLVIENAGTDGRFNADPYIIAKNVRSVLCLPILKQGRFLGLLYLENNAVAGAFTRERVNLLTLLSGQIAVSIDNSLLYEKLEQKVAERTAELQLERKKSDDLLFNILPVETARELRQNGTAEARYYEQVSVIFTDFKGFTTISEKLNPTELVAEIHECFKAFDMIIEKYGIEKIKTIGDAYMAASGLPVVSATHARDLVRAALDMRDYILERNNRKNGPPFEVRIGIHSGPVVAGIVGLRKFQYDIWGDTVNTASRMESCGIVGKVNISENTYQLVQDLFQCEFRGEIEAKGKGRIRMYFAEPKQLSPQS